MKCEQLRTHSLISLGPEKKSVTPFGLPWGMGLWVMTAGSCLLRRSWFQSARPFVFNCDEMPLNAKCEFLDFVLVGDFLWHLLSVLIGD